MCPVIRVTDELYQRLERHAVGFDSPSKVIERLLDEVEGVETPPSESTGSSHTSTSSRLFTNKEIQQRIVEIARELPAQELEALCDSAVSKELFGISFPLFVRVSDKSNQATKRKAVKTPDGINRWTWKYEFSKDGYVYAICTQWYPKQDLYVKAWLDENR